MIKSKYGFDVSHDISINYKSNSSYDQFIHDIDYMDEYGNIYKEFTNFELISIFNYEKFYYYWECENKIDKRNYYICG